jgi:hypothetical protein
MIARRENKNMSQLDMGREMEFDTIITTLGHTDDSPGSYKVLLSKDGNNRETVDEGENRSIYTCKT